jgi:cobalt-zinc-cadmium efflux system protein
MDHQNHTSQQSTHAGHSMPKVTEENARALKITGWLTGVYFFIELAIGIWTGSVAVTSDAFHTFSAVGGVMIALVATRLAARPATHFQTFGLIRAEIVGALFNGLFLFGMAVFVFWMGYMRLQNPIDLSTGPMLWAATGGIFTELIALKLLYAKQKGNLNMKGAFWHIIQTFVGSLLIIVTALVIRFTGFLAIDPILGMVFGTVLLLASWSIMREALHILLDNVPKDLDLNAVKMEIEKLQNVKDVHHLHAWALTSGKNIVSIHVLVESFTEETQAKIQTLLKDKFNIYFSTVQAETKPLESKEADAIDFRSQD